MFSLSEPLDRGGAGLTRLSVETMQLRGRKIPRRAQATEAVSQSNGLPPLSPLPAPPSPLCPLSRLYVYSLHGLLCELLFTSLWDLFSSCGVRSDNSGLGLWEVLSSCDVRLRGHSSVWALPMYGGALLVLEKLQQRLTVRGVVLPVRLLLYTAFIYLWELTWGATLSLLRACPWDYSEFQYNFRGLVTLEYAPFWAAAAFVAERFVIKETLRIQM